jgi:hypothetical protein
VTKIYYLELLRASEGTLSRWSRLHLQSLAPTNQPIQSTEELEIINVWSPIQLLTNVA